MAWVRDLQEILLWQAGVQCTPLFYFNEVLYNFPLIFPECTSWTTAGRTKREADDPAEPQVLEFFAVKVGCECPL